ncbi:MAG: M23 family metallopeptidase [Solirubrobacterales bacterium]|nr:M23 family metallopeptidase [Solirubrobacterales bacterium]
MRGHVSPRRALLALGALIACLIGPATASAEEAFTPIVAQPIAPARAVVATDGKKHVAYELLVSNYSSAPTTIKRIDRFDGRRRLAPVTGEAISGMLKPFASAPGTDVLGPGQSGFILLDLALPRRAKLPTRISHQFVVGKSDAPLKFVSKFRTGTVRVLGDPAVQVRPPLVGPGWVVANGCCAEFTSHRGAVLPVNGRFHNSERFAIDFMQIQPDGLLVNGAWESLDNYPFFGDPILSATRGTVVRVVKDIPETQPSGNLPPASAARAGGNYVVVRSARKRFAFYAHMQPGSARVKVGQRVRAGQILGLLGSTGNSNAPHLHFHMMDGPDPLASNGIPYTFSRFGVQGRLLNFGDLFDGVKAQVNSQFAGIHSNQLPLNLQVIDFPNR